MPTFAEFVKRVGALPTSALSTAPPPTPFGGPGSAILGSDGKCGHGIPLAQTCAACRICCSRDRPAFPWICQRVLSRPSSRADMIAAIWQAWGGPK